MENYFNIIICILGVMSIIAMTFLAGVCFYAIRNEFSDDRLKCRKCKYKCKYLKDNKLNN